MKCNLDGFIKDRNEALFSLDKEKLLNYFNKYKIQIPKNELVFWAGIHKARLGIIDIPHDEREKSKKWLTENGFKPTL